MTPTDHNTSTPGQQNLEQIRLQAQRREDAIVKLRSLGYLGPDIAEFLKVPVVNVRQVLRNREREISRGPLDEDRFHFLAMELSVLCRRPYPEILNILARTGKFPDHYFSSIPHTWYSQ